MADGTATSDGIARSDTQRSQLPPIYDPRFRRGQEFLFIMQQMITSHQLVGIKEEFHLGELNNIRCVSMTRRYLLFRAHYRTPECDEWKELEHKIRTIMAKLKEPQIRLLEVKYISKSVLMKCALTLLLLSILFLTLSLYDGGGWHRVISYIFWLATTGALGSAAFIFVNALNIQVDPHVDITSRTFVQLRLILGALFSATLSFPFVYPYVWKFADTLRELEGPQHKIPDTPLYDGLLLLFPFVLGFSTPLVLAILNQAVESVRTLFGVKRTAIPESSGSRSETALVREG